MRKNNILPNSISIGCLIAVLIYIIKIDILKTNLTIFDSKILTILAYNFYIVIIAILIILNVLNAISDIIDKRYWDIEDEIFELRKQVRMK